MVLSASWGKPASPRPATLSLTWNHQELPRTREPVLVCGQGRSYGDSCLNSEGRLLDTHRLDRVLSFDQERGLIRCEAGMTFADLIDICLPQGWFPKVVPGTAQVTLGGALANDIHGKNHHREGTFGCSVVRFELVRSDGQRLVCDADQHSAFFKATIGGLGLTGWISWLELSLIPVANAWMETERRRYPNLEALIEGLDQADQHWAYTVAWLDGTAPSSRLGRGVLLCGRHAAEEAKQSKSTVRVKRRSVQVPFLMPSWFLNRLSIGMFNRLYFFKAPRKPQYPSMDYRTFFFPLDRVRNWNRLYGRRGLLQYQCVLEDPSDIQKMLLDAKRSGTPPFLAVLKRFDSQASPGLLSFPRPGYTLALDFPDSARARAWIAAWNQRVQAVYPAKDACMDGTSFRRFFPNWETWQASVDPAFQSDFWRRMNQEQPS